MINTTADDEKNKSNQKDTENRSSSILYAPFEHGLIYNNVYGSLWNLIHL